MKKWLKTGGNNVVLRAKWGRISYNPDTRADDLGREITNIVNALGKDVKDGEETALYDGKKWRILTGDFRDEYEAAFPNLKKCLAVYEKHKEQDRNSYSTD